MAGPGAAIRREPAAVSRRCPSCPLRFVLGLEPTIRHPEARRARPSVLHSEVGVRCSAWRVSDTGQRVGWMGVDVLGYVHGSARVSECPRAVEASGAVTMDAAAVAVPTAGVSRCERSTVASIGPPPSAGHSFAAGGNDTALIILFRVQIMLLRVLIMLVRVLIMLVPGAGTPRAGHRCARACGCVCM